MDLEALEMMQWLNEMGDDLPLAESPVDRFAQAEAEKIAAVQKKKAAPSAGSSAIGRAGIEARVEALKARNQPIAKQEKRSEATQPDESVVQSARELAQSAKTLDELKEAMTSFRGCNLQRTAKNMVFADGNPQAKIMLVGEAPGRDEDIQGLPFVGRSGQLLDRMLAAIGLTRETVYITNVIPWRPPGNRTPTPAEVEICRPFIERHMELIAPDLIVMVGGSSAKMMLQTTEGILRLRGNWKTLEVSDKKVDAIATLHPAYLLRQPSQKKLAWQDLLMVKAKLEEEA